MKLWSSCAAIQPVPEFSMDDGSSLLWLAFLLTGDGRTSEKALLKALDQEAAGHGYGASGLETLTACVISESLSAITLRLAASERRTELQPSAMGEPPMQQQFPEPAWSTRQAISEDVLEASLLAIDLFPRCVLLLTVFQKYTLDHAVSLLGTTKRLAQSAQRIALTELTRNVALRQGWRPLQAAHTSALAAAV